MDEFIKKFKIEEFLIKRFNYWSISLRPIQTTLGSLIISLNRKCPKLSELTTKEASEMKEVFQYIEKILMEKFSPEKINYLALMMVDHQVHFHVIPRYKEERIMGGKVFVDCDWPAPPNILHNEGDKHLLSIIYKSFI